MSHVDRYAEWFVELDPQSLRDSNYKTIVVLFPNLQQSAWVDCLEQAEDQLMAKWIPRGVIMRACHPGPSSRTALWNPDFYSRESPVPLIAISTMVPTDFPLVKSRRDYMEAYLRIHGDNIPAPMSAAVQKAAARFNLRLPDSSPAREITIIADLDAVPAELITALLGDLDAYHRALGGGGLTIRTINTGSDVNARVFA